MEKKFNYQKIECKSALNHIKSFLPYEWDLNIYRGCEHQCVYCFAQYSHKYLEDSDFFHNIYIKENIASQLEKKLQSNSWNRSAINIGGVTDSYQPIEEQYQLMPQILKLLIKYKTPAIISTKSSLILRDVELLKELSKVASVEVACTITTLDQNIASYLEPNASPVKERIKTLKKLKEAGITVGWHLMPIIPYITATRSNLTEIFKIAKDIHIDYMICSMLNLRGTTRTEFFSFLKRTYPLKYADIWKLYNNKESKKEYKKQLASLLNTLSKEYGISRDYLRFVPKNNIPKTEQISLF